MDFVFGIVTGFAFGAGIVWIVVKPDLDRLAKLTDRDERGRFVRREP